MGMPGDRVDPDDFQRVSNVGKSNDEELLERVFHPNSTQYGLAVPSGENNVMFLEFSSCVSLIDYTFSSSEILILLPVSQLMQVQLNLYPLVL